jgi:hypothetical protein
MVLEGKSQGRKLFETARRKWEDNIKMNFVEMGWDRSGSG